MDTVIIKLYGNFQIGNRSSFLPELLPREYKDLSETEKRSKRYYLRKYRLDVNKHNNYIPKVEIFETLKKDSKELLYIMKIEFSAPKLLYWNSLQEVGGKHKDKIIGELIFTLKNVDIHVKKEIIENALVSGVHVCKNIPLPKEIRMREVIDELSKIDINKAFDISSKQDKKGARILNIYSGTIDWAFYDKISDSLRPKNKRRDKHLIEYEREFIEKYNLQDKEVFRYEYRIKKAQTIKRDINSILGRDYQTKVCFKDLFSPDLLKKLTINSWNTILDKPENQLSLFRDTSKLTILLHIVSRAKDSGKGAHSANNALVAYGITTAIKDHGAKEIKSIMTENWFKDHPERFTKKIKMTSNFMKGLPVSDSVFFISKAIKKYELIDLALIEKGI